MKATYCTFDNITLNTGAGKVCYHEVKALSKVMEIKQIICRDCDINDLEHVKIEVDKWYPFNPFLFDYFASLKVDKTDFLHLNCSPGIAVLERAKPDKYVVNIAAHNLQLSIEEHERLFGKGSYPFIHNTEPYLHKVLLQHAKEANRIITPSKASKQWILENVVTDESRVVVIPHGCDLPKEVKPYPRDFRVGYLGVFGPDKGLIYLLMAWNHMLTKEATLVFAGSCQEVLTYAQMIVRNGPPIVYKGYVPTPSDLFNDISVYVQPSVTEGFGIPVLEAMAHARPVIVSSGAGASDLVTDGKEGFVVPPRNPKAIRDRIQYFLDNPSEIERMGKNAEMTAKQYTWDKIEEMYVKLYQEVVG